MRMKLYKHLFLLSTFALLALTATAQSQEQAKKLFNEGKYEEAKPAFQKLIKRNPKNGSLNYWYGVCLYETGEADKSISYLTHAAQREVREANRYLAMYYSDNYQYAKSEEYWEIYFELMEEAKKPFEQYHASYDHASLGRQMMRGVKDITIIDSIVTDKENFLSSYSLSKEAGTLTPYNKFFNQKDQPNGIVYQTETKNKIYYSASVNDKMRLYSSDMLIGNWDKGHELKGIDTKGNCNYPYISSDGTTLYFATEGEESLGGYDIFVTRYNNSNGQYLKPENLGMPFNSPANDYMLVIDEYNHLGWFATDRNQPSGNVCIYIFIPTESYTTLDENELTPNQLINRAKLLAIKDTWKNPSDIQQAKQRIANAQNIREEEEIKKDFELIINDMLTYYTLQDFRSKEARELATRWRQEIKNHTTLSNQLESKRDAYASSNDQQRNSMKASILDMEKRVDVLEKLIAKLELDTRNAENQHLGKK